MKKEIMSHENLKIDLLPVLESDWDYILHLNQQFVKNYHVDSKPTKKQDHYNYMEKQKTNPNFHQWMIGFGEKKIGHVRILEYDVGIMIDSEYQNKGISTIALKILEKKAKKLKIKKLVGVVRIDNLSSEKIFQKNNYDFIMKWYEKKII
jgi:RimJ/RimL family protein N-acetyltransferase